MKSFLADVNIYEEEQADGRILRSLKFRFPVFFNGKEMYELDWDNEPWRGMSAVEENYCLSRFQGFSREYVPVFLAGKNVHKTILKKRG